VDTFTVAALTIIVTFALCTVAVSVVLWRQNR
jgi:hypothetical protein